MSTEHANSRARLMADALIQQALHVEPDLHIIILAVHPTEHEYCAIAAINLPERQAINLLREQADGMEADLKATAS